MSRRVLAALSPCGLPGDASHRGACVSVMVSSLARGARALSTGSIHYTHRAVAPGLRSDGVSGYTVWAGSKDRQHNSTSEQEGHYLQIKKQHARRCQRRAVSRVPVQEGSQRDLYSYQHTTNVAVKRCSQHFRLDFFHVVGFAAGFGAWAKVRQPQHARSRGQTAAVAALRS